MGTDTMVIKFMNYNMIGVPIVNGSATFFVGTGVSRFLTDNKAPSWTELLAELTIRIDSKMTLYNKLFDSQKRTYLDPYICAQILENEYGKLGKNIRYEIKTILDERINHDTINQDKLASLKGFFSKHMEINVITTNYDTLLSDYVMSGNFPQIVTDGSPVPRSNDSGNVFHIHGCISNPESLVFTINDYFRFQHKDSYLSRKFFTLLQETTIIIIGYSLGDFNLNGIINESQSAGKLCARGNDIYLMSRDIVDTVVKDYYKHTYGINVEDSVGIDELFFKLSLPESEQSFQQIADGAKSLVKVISGELIFTDEFIKTRSALSTIFEYAKMQEITFDNKPFIETLIKLLDKKRELCGLPNAWEQYAHLAEWIIDIGKRIEFHGMSTTIKEQYVNLAFFSLSTMDHNGVGITGCSWEAFNVWNSRYNELLQGNQVLLKSFNWWESIKVKFGLRSVVTI